MLVVQTSVLVYIKSILKEGGSLLMESLTTLVVQTNTLELFPHVGDAYPCQWY